MGGYFSGNFKVDPKPCVEYRPALDPTRLDHLGWLKSTPEWVIHELQWLNPDFETATTAGIGIWATDDFARLILPCATSTKLVKVPRPRNAHCWRVICPTCNTRRNRLYLRNGVFRCRVCHALCYASQRDGSTKWFLRRLSRGVRRERPAWQCHPKGQYVTDYRLGVGW